MTSLARVVKQQYDATVQQPQDQYAFVGPRFGVAVTSVRAALGWSQRTLAEHLNRVGVNIDASGLSRIENGTRMPRLDEAVAISNVTGMGLQHMMLWAPDPAAVQVSQGAQRLERLREALLRDLASYNRLRLELAFAADDFLQDLEADDPANETHLEGVEDLDGLHARVRALMLQGPLDVAAAYEGGHSDAVEQLAGDSINDAAARIVQRDRDVQDEVEPNTGAFMSSTLYRGSDNSATDKHQLGRATADEQHPEAP